MKIFRPSIRRIPIHRGGRLDSDKLSSIFRQTVDDIVGLSDFASALSVTSDETARASISGDLDLRQRVEQALAEIEALRKANAVDGLPCTYGVTLYDSSKVGFLSASPSANRCAINTTFGEATVPFNGIEPRFYQENVNTQALIPIENIAVSVTGTFDASDGQGVVNHESGGTITEGDPLRAFNGNNSSTWTRKVSYPLDSDVSEVLCEITVDLPEGSGSQSNIIYVIPYPLGDVDILGLYTSADLGNSFSSVSGFSTVEGAGPKRWIFPAQQVQRVKIRLRQRNWVEEDGRKVFYYGAQEIGLQLADFDKTYSSGSPVTSNNTFVMKQSAPSGYVFNNLTYLDTNPSFTLEDVGLRHVHLKVSTDAAGSNIVWDSDVDALPQDQVNGHSLGTTASILYFIITLNWVASSGGASSPFSVYSTPVFRSLEFSAETEVE